MLQQPMPATSGTPHFASLYVGDLDPEVSEAMLYEIFNTVGPVASIRVCRDSVTRRSLGYAYVNFHSATDAERVMDTLNYSTIKGRCCRIMWSHRDPNLRKTGNGNVFVKNLDKNVDNKALYDTFSLFGNILSCKVATDSEGKSRGYGFVHYETTEAAKQAIEKVNNMQIGEKTVFVGEFVPRDGRSQPEITNFTNIYVKNLPKDWDEPKLLEEFAKFGTITSSMVQKDKKDRHFAFINYETSEAAHKAIAALHKTDIRTDKEKEEAEEDKEGEKKEEEEYDAERHPDHLMFVSRAMTKVERENMLKSKFKQSSNLPVGVNLYIKNLPDDCTDADLKAMFTQFGEITSAKVMTDAKGRSKGFGFVCYKTPDEATKAVTEMHLKTVKGKPLYVGLAEKKDDRAPRLAARYKGEKGGSAFEKASQSKGGLVTFDGKQQNMMKGYAGKGQYGMVNMAMAGSRPIYGMPQIPQRPFNNMGAMGMQMGGVQGMQMAGAMGGARGMQMGGKGMQMGMQMGGKDMNMGGMQMGMGGAGMGIMGGVPMGGKDMNMGKGGQQMRPQQQSKDGLTAQMLAQAPPGMQKQMLGEKLYPAVSRLQPELAGKITGMMLEMDNSELLMMLDSEHQLKQKVDEAIRVLNTMPRA